MSRHSGSVTKIVWSQLGVTLLGLTSHSSFLCHSLDFDNNTIINGNIVQSQRPCQAVEKGQDRRMCVFLFKAAGTETIPQFLKLTIHLS